MFAVFFFLKKKKIFDKRLICFEQFIFRNNVDQVWQKMAETFISNCSKQTELTNI